MLLSLQLDPRAMVRVIVVAVAASIPAVQALFGTRKKVDLSAVFVVLVPVQHTFCLFPKSTIAVVASSFSVNFFCCTLLPPSGYSCKLGLRRGCSVRADL